MTTRKLAERAAVGVAFIGTVLALAAAPAQGAPKDKPVAQASVKVAPGHGVHPDSGWLGQCYVSRYSTYAGGWCDGNGPDYTYTGTVQCSNGGWYYGPNRWAGDRTGSYASCPSGYTAVQGGVFVYYLGSYYGSVLV